jgi:hypothetical protein
MKLSTVLFYMSLVFANQIGATLYLFIVGDADLFHLLISGINALPR